MPKSITKIIKNIAGKTEVIDLGDSDALYRARVELLQEKIDKAAQRFVNAEERTKIMTLVREYGERTAQRELRFLEIQKEERTDFVTCLEKHLAILEHGQ